MVTLRNFNTLEFRYSNILSVTPLISNTITYDYNNEGAQTKDVDLARRRAKMLFIHRLA